MTFGLKTHVKTIHTHAVAENPIKKQTKTP
jgi:hypothetical protein